MKEITKIYMYLFVSFSEKLIMELEFLKMLSNNPIIINVAPLQHRVKQSTDSISNMAICSFNCGVAVV